MSTDLAIRPQLPSIDDMQRVAKAHAMSGYWPDTRDIAQAFVKVSFGYQVGLPAYVAMSEVHIIQGKPTLGAGALAALVKAHPNYDYRVVEHTGERCALEFFQAGESAGVSEFTMEDAKQAGLTGNATYKKYPRNMLFARAMSNGVAWYCPDVTLGRVYTPDELGSDLTGGTYDDEMVYSPPADTVRDSRSAGVVADPPPPDEAATPATGDGAPEQSDAYPHPLKDDEVLEGEIDDPPDGQFVAPTIDDKQMRNIHAVVRELDDESAPVPKEYAEQDPPEGFTGWTAILKLRLAEMGVASRKDLTKRQADELIAWLKTQKVPF